MAKYKINITTNYIEKEEPDDVLWKINFNIKSEDKIDLKIYVYDLATDTLNDSFPLKYLEKSMHEMGMEKIYDFPFCKEYIFTDNLGLTFIATLTALDMNGSKNSLKLKKKFAELIIQDLDLPREGKMHPEKFLRRLSGKLDFSEKKYEAYDKNFDTLLELENLCSKCLQYETNLEWKIINEEFN